MQEKHVLYLNQAENCEILSVFFSVLCEIFGNKLEYLIRRVNLGLGLRADFAFVDLKSNSALLCNKGHNF